MSPTKLELEKMIEVCQTYSKEYLLAFNGCKSQFIIFQRHGNFTSKIKMGDAELTNMSSVEHLGHRLLADIWCPDIDGITTKFYRQFNSFRCKFENLSPEIQSELFIKYCSSFYGALLQHFKKYRKTLRCVEKSVTADMEITIYDSLW